MSIGLFRHDRTVMMSDDSRILKEQMSLIL